MSPCIAYNDTVTLVKTTVDGYGSQILDDSADVPAVVELNTGYTHAANQDAVTSDAIVLVDPTNAFVQANFYRLEEMLVVIDLFNTPLGDAWYKVESVTVNRDHQLCNQIDNVQLNLKKTVGIAGVS